MLGEVTDNAATVLYELYLTDQVLTGPEYGRALKNGSTPNIEYGKAQLVFPNISWKWSDSDPQIILLCLLTDPLM